ncbi:MAG: putative Ig domain-containing protein [Cyclobacteriaceae bacterium]
MLRTILSLRKRLCLSSLAIFIMAGFSFDLLDPLSYQSLSASSVETNHQIDSWTVGGTAAFQSGFIAEEEAAVVFGPSSVASTLTKVQFLYGSSENIVLNVYLDEGNNDPGALIFSDIYTIGGSTSALNTIDLSAENIQIGANQSFRIAIEMAVAGTSSVAIDVDGISASTSNYANLQGFGWVQTTTLGFGGDWVIRAATVETNVAPILSSVGDHDIDELEALTFDALATDANQPPQSLTYSIDATSIGKGMDIGPSSGSFSWTPTEAQDGDHIVSISVSDGALADSETFTISVGEINVAPILEGIGDRAVDELVELSFAASASDQDLAAQTLTYSVDAVSLGKGMNIESLTGIFSWTPTEAQDGDHTVSISVSDGALADSETFTISVGEVNVAPTLEEIEDRAVDELVELSFAASASDQDLAAQTLSYSIDATSLGKGMNIESSSGIFSWTPADGQDGEHSVTISVSDGALSDSKVIMITVRNTQNTITGHVDEPSAFQIYPNPVGRELHLRLYNDYRGSVVLRLYDLAGKVVFEQSFHKSSQSLEAQVILKDVSSNVFLSEVKFDQTRLQGRLVKK